MPNLGDSDSEDDEHPKEKKGVEPMPKEEIDPWITGKDPADMTIDELIKTIQVLHRRFGVEHSKTSDMHTSVPSVPSSTLPEDVDNRSHEGWAPMSDDDSPEEEIPQDAIRQPPMSKPAMPTRRPEIDEKYGVNGLFRLYNDKGELNNVDKKNWEFMPYPLVVDSGAAETVIPSDWFTDHKLYELMGSKSGMIYRS